MFSLGKKLFQWLDGEEAYSADERIGPPRDEYTTYLERQGLATRGLLGSYNYARLLEELEQVRSGVIRDSRGLLKEFPPEDKTSENPRSSTSP